MYGNACKTRNARNTKPLRKHINFNINQLREDTRKLLIDENNEERIAIENYVKQLHIAQDITRANNNELWKMVEQAVRKQQATNFPPAEKQIRKKKGKLSKKSKEKKN